jgi:choline dehydrogenase-like flavoprotein
MLVDARTVPDGARIECDIAIVGAGAAGLTIARQFIGSGRNVCLVESGGFELDQDTQALYDGDNVGLPYFPLDSCRLRYFGGTTNHWSGHCVPYKEPDFEEQSWVPGTPWPIKLADVAPYYERASALLGFPELGWDVAAWEQELDASRLSFDPDRLSTTMTLINPVRFGQVYRQEFAEADNLRVCLNANVVEVQSNEAATIATGVRVRTLAGNGFTVAARFIVLAAGGIANPRLLLLSDRVQRDGLGNQNDLVGRFFLENPLLAAGTIQPANPGIPIWFYRRHHLAWGDVLPFIMLANEVQQREQLVPVALVFSPILDHDSEGVEALRAVVRNVRQGEWPDDLMEHIGKVVSDFGSVAELAYERVRYGQIPVARVDCSVIIVPLPNPDSRVTLGEERDDLGLRRVRLDWRLSDLDKRSARRMMELLALEVGRTGLGRVKSTIDDDDSSWPEVEPTYHHVGTTRMADDPKKGVVDGNGKVHGISNLYIAGSSVFPTAGTGSPTMMIIALAMRLADHLKGLAA